MAYMEKLYELKRKQEAALEADFICRPIPNENVSSSVCAGYRPPPGAWTPGQGPPPCCPGPWRNRNQSVPCVSQHPMCARKRNEYTPPQCPLETNECLPRQCSTEYRPPPGCCMPPGEEEHPCIPDPRYKEPPQCAPEYRPPPGCCMPPVKDEHPCIPEPCRRRGYFEPRYNQPPQCPAECRPTPKCCFPTGQDQPPCFPAPCRLTSYKQPQPPQCSLENCTEPGAAQSMGYGCPTGEDDKPSNCGCP